MPVAAKILTPHGFPWPKDYPLWHTTIGYRSLLKTGFRTRQQLADASGGRAVHAAGGGTSRAVSFSCDYRVCEAILIGLGTLRRGALGELDLNDLWSHARAACPKGASAAWKSLLSEGWTQDRQDRFVEGLVYNRPFSGLPFKRTELPPGAQVITSWFHHLNPGKSPETDWDRNAHRNIIWDYWGPVTEEEKQDKFAEHYKKILAFGESARECYDPLFFGTSMPALAALAEADLGVVEAQTSIPRIVMDGSTAVRFGYLTKAQAYYRDETLRSWDHRAKFTLDSQADTRSKPDPDDCKPAVFAMPGYSLRDGEEIGPFTVKSDSKPWSGRTSLVAMSSMAEVRCYAPDLCRVSPPAEGSTESGTEFFARVGYPLFHRYFSEFEGLLTPLPGEAK